MSEPKTSSTAARYRPWPTIAGKTARIGISTMVVLAVLAFSRSAHSQPPDGWVVSVFITSSEAINGITYPSKEQQDTVRDLQKEIAKRVSMKLVTTRDNPIVTVVVIGRQTAPRTSAATGRPLQDRMISVRLLYLDTAVEMTASSQGDAPDSGEAWAKAAETLAKQLDEWVNANREWLKTSRRFPHHVQP